MTTTDTQATIKRLCKAQLAYTQELLTDEKASNFDYGDDGYDALKGAMLLAAELMMIDIDDDEMAYKELMDDGLTNYSVDSICDDIWREKPKSLADYED